MSFILYLIWGAITEETNLSTSPSFIKTLRYIVAFLILYIGATK